MVVAGWSTLMPMESPPEPGPEISVVVPVYNEIDNLQSLVERVRATLDQMELTWELVAVDDGSTDGSGERLDELAEAEQRIRVLHFQENCGQSAGLDAGFKHARGRLMALLDADLQTFPEDLPKLIDMLESLKLDAVVGIRAERHDSGWKRFSSRLANGVRNRLTREDIQDTGCPIKVFRAEAIRSVRFFTGTHRFLPTLLRMEGYTVKQVPVRHTERKSGTSKYGTWDRAFSGLRDALGVRWLQDRHMKWKLRD
jgi:glycosyltransferase involved in cell wall biosynthesis